MTCPTKLHPRCASSIVLALGFSFALTACSDEERRIARTCEVAERYFNLTEDEQAKCERDETYRASLVVRRDEALARELTKTHNRDLGTLRPVAEAVGSYARVNGIADLPIKGTGIAPIGDREAEGHVGERYVIAGTLSGTPSDGADGISLVVTAGGDGNEFALLSPDALNTYQRAFILRHCSFNAIERSSSMCRGDAFISVRRDARGAFIKLTLDGAAFDPAIDSAVLAAVSQP